MSVINKLKKAKITTIILIKIFKKIKKESNVLMNN